jgi:hypothetical protein
LPRLVLEAIIAGQAGHQLAAPPVIENEADILARNPSHTGKIALSNLLVNHNAVSQKRDLVCSEPNQLRAL